MWENDTRLPTISARTAFEYSEDEKYQYKKEIVKLKRKKLTDHVGLKSSLRIKLRRDGKEILETKKEGQIEKRISRKTARAIYIVYKADKIVHLHCKDSTCGNEWKVKEGTDWTGKFEVNGIRIKCLKCGGVYEFG